MLKNKLSIGIMVGGVIGVFAAFMYFTGLYTRLAGASISEFSPSNCYTSSATSTLSYMTAGKATTTLTCAMGLNGATSAILAIEVNASSTATVFNVYPEESMDGQDWYPIAVNQNSSSTAPYSLTPRTYYEFSFASSTIGGVGTGTGLKGASTTFEGYTSVNNRNHYVMDVPTRMKYVRAYMTIPIGATPGAVWMRIIPRQAVN